MWRDPGVGQEQLEGLAAELIEAGRIARIATARREIPDPKFAASLRDSLMSQLPQLRTVDGLAPVPPTRPRGWVGPERRAAGRPMTGSGRKWVAQDEVLHVDTPAPEATPPHSGKRWTRAEPAAPVAAAIDAEAAAAVAHVATLRPAVRWHMPVRVMPARWVAVGLAASLAVVSLMYGAVSLFPAGPTATAQVAVDATLTRSGLTVPLAAGSELKSGDQIAVAQGGQATIAVGGSFIRMASGSSVRLDGLDPNHVVVDQLDGRAYHRVSVEEGGKYTVVTGSVKWIATGTAFDIDRHPWGADGEEVRGLALLDGLTLAGFDVNSSLDEGQSATIRLSGSDEPDGGASVVSISADTLADAWLIQNAQLDYLAGLDLGELATLVSPSPTATPTDEPSPTKPQAIATPKPTAKTTPKPTPKPTPAGPANLGSLTIAYDAGTGKYTFSWPKYTGTWSSTGHTFYKLVHEPWGTTPSYPESPYWACLYDRYTHNWVGSIDSGDYAVRAQVVDDSSGAIVIRAQTNVVHFITLPPTQSLGSLGFDAGTPGQVTFSWTGYSGGWEYSYYKLVYGPIGSNPSFLAGAAYLAAPGAGQTEVTLSVGAGAFTAGAEYDLRIQAVGYPYGPAYVFGETSILTFTVPTS